MPQLAKQLRIALRRAPRLAVAVAAGIPRQLTALCVGWLGSARRRELDRVGVQVVEEPFAADALRIARARRFDRVLVDPDCADAFAFVRSIKAPHSIHRSVPLLVMPVAPEPDYAIIVEPPHWSWLQSERDLPLKHAVAWLDIEALIRSSPRRG